MKARFARLPLRFDAPTLQAEVRQLEQQTWPTHFNTGYHDGGWSGIALVSDDGDAQRLYADPSSAAAARPTGLLAGCPALQAAIAGLPGPVRSARLLRLAPGSVIREHRDYGLGIEEGLVRLHVPIVSSPDVEFYVDGVRVPMAEGECWYLDLGLPHRVSNPGRNERIHLVVDCEVGAALLALLPEATDVEPEVLALSKEAPESAGDQFERFRAGAFEDRALLADLRRHGDVDSFIAAVVRAGARSGLRFGPEDVRAAMQAGRRAWIERMLC